MRRRTFLLAGVSALVVTRPAYALFGVGDIVFDPTQYTEQLWQAATQAKQYATELMSQVTQLEQLKNMIQNTISLPLQLWQQVQGLMWQVQSVTQLGSLLSGNSGSIIQRLNSLEGYANQVTYLGSSLGALPDQFNNWQHQLGNSFGTLGKALGIQQDDLKTQASFQQSIQQQAATAGGQMQAIQAGVQMAASNGAILQQIEQTLIASAQTTANYQEVQADRQAIRDNATLAATQWNDQPMAGSKSW